MNRFAYLLILLSIGTVSCTTDRAASVPCPYDLHEVITQAGWTNVVPIQAIRWRQQKDDRPLVVDNVILLGSQGTNYVLLSAYRHPVGGGNVWNRTEISVMFDWGDDWIIGERTYSSLPTEQDVANFLEETWWDEGKDRFQKVFEGNKTIEKPTTD